MTNTVHPLRIVSFGGDSNIFNRHVDGNIEVELRHTLGTGEEVVIDVTIPASVLKVVGWKAVVSPTAIGEAVSGGITAKVRKRRR